ncbi:S8 family serine peptidase [Robertmurraya korlensis]|uniref:S8 family serine peptidase n=1 Tax=Robertmurraya korlensis TaxID=519977 RepID=UPI00203AE134|nr:S8 family serine peptidase [Robertmurraya korlensis]MCM3602458.1 S8 family serine peptidase [Robertmurraya korlensis]
MKKRTLGSVLISAAMGLSLFASGALGAEQESTSKDTYRVYIQGPQNEKSKAKQTYGLRWDFGNDGFTTTVNESQYNALLKNKNLTIQMVEEVSLENRSEVNAKPGVSAQALPSDQTPWGIQAIYNDSSVQKTSGGAGVKVAVLDTGVYTSHIDLAGSAEQCKDFTQTKSPLVNGSCSDRNGHGTHVAGTVLAHGGNDGLGIYGVAPEADLWAYKVLNDRGSGYSDDIAGAIRHAADEATRTGSKVIISMSLGSSSKDTMIANAVDYAYSKGLLVVAAAGNSGSASNTIGYPGALVNAVAVAALENVQQNGTYRVADFSSRGNPNTDGDFVIQERDVEVSAPGAAIESTWYNGGYNTISGTSMATPHVSGLAAKIWAANPSLSHTQLRSELQNRAKSYDINGGIGAASGDDYASGFGFPRVR